jgi:hypothetical protein
MKAILIGFLTFLLFALSNNQSSFIFGQKVGSEPDLVFNVQGLKTSPVTKEFQITGEVWDEICPSNQCQIEEYGYSSYIITPNPEDSAPRVYLMLDFFIHDDIANKNLTPIQKKFVERYVLSFSCSVKGVNDIVELGNNTVYKCSGDFTSLGKRNEEFSNVLYYYKVQGIYDNQSDTLNGTGQFDGKPRL